MKSGYGIHDITEKNAEGDLLYVQPTNPDLHKATWMNTAYSERCRLLLHTGDVTWSAVFVSLCKAQL